MGDSETLDGIRVYIISVYNRRFMPDNGNQVNNNKQLRWYSYYALWKSFKIEFSIIFILEDLWWQNAWIYFVTLKIDVFVVNILYNLPVICVMVIR